MRGFEAIVEQRIREAAQRGDFDDLPGCGRPLELDDDRLVPEELRMAYRLLKNAGYVPPEVEQLRELAELERFALAAEGEARSQALRKLHLLMQRMESERGGNLRLAADYYERLAERLSTPVSR